MFGGSPKERLQAAIDRGDLMQLKLAITDGGKGGVEAALIKVREGLANACHRYGITPAFKSTHYSALRVNTVSTGHSLSHSLNCAALAQPTSTSPPDASPPPGRLNAPCPIPFNLAQPKSYIHTHAGG